VPEEFRVWELHSSCGKVGTQNGSIHCCDSCGGLTVNYELSSHKSWAHTRLQYFSFWGIIGNVVVIDSGLICYQSCWCRDMSWKTKELKIVQEQEQNSANPSPASNGELLWKSIIDRRRVKTLTS
jgi:hypothetical protein